MDLFVFRGFPEYLRRAAEELNLDVPLAAGSPPAPLAAMASLCAQASTADRAHVAGILREAAAHRDHLRIASRAAELMLVDVGAARMPDVEAEEPSRPRANRSTKRTAPARP